MAALLGQEEGTYPQDRDVVNERGRIRAVTPSTPGSRHEWKHIVETGVIEKTPPWITAMGDAGLDGLQNHYPERSIGTPKDTKDAKVS